MSRSSVRLLGIAGILMCGLSTALADSPKEAAAAAKPAAPAGPKKPAFADVLGNAENIEGLIKLYRKEGRLFAELSPGDFNKDLIIAIAIARGIGQLPLVGGWTWNGGNEWIWQFRKVDDRVHIVRRNVRFRATQGTPTEKAMRISYTDSILFSLPVVTTSPTGGVVIDLTPVFLSDLPQITELLRGFAVDPNRSTWSKVKGFKNNVEIEVAATYASGGQGSADTVPDTRGVTIYVHYSISQIPQTGYQPRLADDRVGHFVTALKDFSKSGGDDQFVRYVNRWDLRKVEPSAAVSPPVAPIIFWIEKSVPYKFRAAVREGILDWNKAFEKAGFSNAIEVRQQPDDAAWDPEDISYNTFRWGTSNAALAVGPSRVNPLTGQILDADILCDADFIEFWTKALNVERGGLLGDKPGKGRGNSDDLEEMQHLLVGRHRHAGAVCNCAQEMANQLAIGAMSLAAGGHVVPKDQMEKLLTDGIKSVVTHEVGHTLGLRHNFKASTLFSMEELNVPEKTKEVGLASSVMDYVPVNVSPKGKPQGDFFSRSIGPYDYWAIEYAYKPLLGGTEGEVAALEKIARRSTEPALDYATDEDADGSGDPLVNRHDLSKDPIEFARWRLEMVNQLIPDLVAHTVEPGEGYQRARQALAVLMRDHERATHYVARYVGGVHGNRDHKGQPNARPPFVVTEPKKQREALAFLNENVFGPKAYNFPTDLYNYLAQAHWRHWGMKDGARPDVAVHQMVRQLQDRVFDQILSQTTLSRLLDSEMKVPAKQDAFTAAELLEGLTTSIFSETDSVQTGKFTNREPAVTPLRRDLQRDYFRRLADLAMGSASNTVQMGRMSLTMASNAPADCQTVAFAQIGALEGRLKKALSSKAELDTYTRAHWTELASRAHKVIAARLELPKP